MVEITSEAHFVCFIHHHVNNNNANDYILYVHASYLNNAYVSVCVCLKPSFHIFLL